MAFVQTNEDAYLCGQATREEMADNAREHYTRISSYAGSRFPTIAKAIDAWEREPELLERIEGLEKELKQLREKTKCGTNRSSRSTTN